MAKKNQGPVTTYDDNPEDTRHDNTGDTSSFGRPDEQSSPVVEHGEEPASLQPDNSGPVLHPASTTKKAARDSKNAEEASPVVKHIDQPEAAPKSATIPVCFEYPNEFHATMRLHAGLGYPGTKDVVFVDHFYRTSDPDEIAALRVAVKRFKHIFEVPSDTSRPLHAPVQKPMPPIPEN